MKYKITTWGAVLLGLVAGGIRVAQYLFTLDGEGAFDLNTPLAGRQSQLLTLLLCVGVLFVLVMSFFDRNEEAHLSTLYGNGLTHRLLFGLVGLILLVVGGITLAQAVPHMDRAGIISGGSALLGAIGWLGMLHSPKRAGLMSVLPVLWAIVQLVQCFWRTYKYVHNTTFILEMLGWCSVLCLVTALARVIVGAEVSKGRLSMVAGFGLVLLPAAFVAPVVRFSPHNLLTALWAAALVLLAALTLYALRHWDPESPDELQSPDLSELEVLLESIPDPEE